MTTYTCRYIAHVPCGMSCENSEALLTCICAEVSKLNAEEQNASEGFLKLQEDNAQLHAEVTRLDKKNKSLQASGIHMAPT